MAFLDARSTTSLFLHVLLTWVFNFAGVVAIFAVTEMTLSIDASNLTTLSIHSIADNC